MVVLDYILKAILVLLVLETVVVILISSCGNHFLFMHVKMDQ